MQDKDSISYIAFESVCARFERTIKRLWILLIIMLMMLGCSVYTIGYLLTEYETVETTVTQDNADGYNNFIGNDGDIINGETDN
jgi:hypothetical protein